MFLDRVAHFRSQIGLEPFHISGGFGCKQDLVTQSGYIIARVWLEFKFPIAASAHRKPSLVSMSRLGTHSEHECDEQNLEHLFTRVTGKKTTRGEIDMAH